MGNLSEIKSILSYLILSYLIHVSQMSYFDKSEKEHQQCNILFAEVMIVIMISANQLFT